MADAIGFALELIVVLQRKCAEMGQARAAVTRLAGQLPAAHTLLSAVQRIWTAVEARRALRDGEMGGQAALDPVEVQRAILEPGLRVAGEIRAAEELIDKVAEMSRMKQFRQGGRTIGRVEEAQAALSLAIQALNANLQAWRTSIEITQILDASGVGETPFQLPAPAAAEVEEPPAVATLRDKLARYPTAIATREARAEALRARQQQLMHQTRDWIEAFGKTDEDAEVANARQEQANVEAEVAELEGRIAELRVNKEACEEQLAGLVFAASPEAAGVPVAEPVPVGAPVAGVPVAEAPAPAPVAPPQAPPAAAGVPPEVLAAAQSVPAAVLAASQAGHE